MTFPILSRYLHRASTGRKGGGAQRRRGKGTGGMTRGGKAGDGARRDARGGRGEEEGTSADGEDKAVDAARVGRREGKDGARGEVERKRIV